MQLHEQNSRVLGKIAISAKRMDVRMKTVTFRLSRHISLLLFPDKLKTVCDINRIDEGAAAWSLPHFIQKPAKNILSKQVTADIKKDRQQEGKPTMYFEVVNYLLEMYATNDVIAETEDEIDNSKQYAGIMAVCYLEVYREEVPRCSHVNHESRLMGVFIQILHVYT